jgi:hypothetical protein
MLSSSVTVDGHPAPNTCANIFKTFIPVVANPLRENTVPAFVLKVVDGLRPPDTPCEHKNRIAQSYSALVQTERRAAMINGEAVTMELA